MNTVSKLFTEPSALRLESALNELVLALNHRRLSILNSYHVGELEVEIIRFLHEHEQKKMKEVGEHFNIKLSTLTSTIDKLEKNKLVKRKNSKEDRRVIYIRPTAKGQNLLTDLVDATRDLAEKMVADLNAADFDSMIRGLDQVLDLLRKK